MLCRVQWSDGNRSTLQLIIWHRDAPVPPAKLKPPHNQVSQAEGIQFNEQYTFLEWPKQWFDATCHHQDAQADLWCLKLQLCAVFLTYEALVKSFIMKHWAAGCFFITRSKLCGLILSTVARDSVTYLYHTCLKVKRSLFFPCLNYFFSINCVTLTKNFCESLLIMKDGVNSKFLVGLPFLNYFIWL